MSAKGEVMWYLSNIMLMVWCSRTWTLHDYEKTRSEFCVTKEKTQAIRYGVRQRAKVIAPSSPATLFFCQ